MSTERVRHPAAGPEPVSHRYHHEGQSRGEELVGFVAPAQGNGLAMLVGEAGLVEVKGYKRRRRRRPARPQMELFETLEAAREKVQASLDVGIRCPCCDQHAKRYRRKITSSMAWALVLVLRHFLKHPEARWLHLEDHFKAQPGLPSKVRGDAAKLAHWELLERLEGKRSDGSNRLGYYRITRRGIAFAKGKLAVEQFALIYNGQCQGFVGDLVTIDECWTEGFDYRELMRPPDGQGGEA